MFNSICKDIKHVSFTGIRMNENVCVYEFSDVRPVLIVLFMMPLSASNMLLSEVIEGMPLTNRLSRSLITRFVKDIHKTTIKWLAPGAPEPAGNTLSDKDIHKTRL